MFLTIARGISIALFASLPELLGLTTISRRHLPAALALTAVVCLAVVLWDILAGGFYFRVLGVRVSSWDPYKPFRVGVLAIVGAMWLHDHNVSPDRVTWQRLIKAGPFLAGAAALICAAVAIRFGIRAAGGADAYGYVSEAHSIAAGRLTIPNPLAAVTASLGPAVAPLGYRLADDPAWLVPTYSPGLPLLMAIALRLAGPSSVYFVVPLLGGATVWLTYLLGRRVADARVAMLASLLVAFSPIVIFQSIEPMSDIPVTAAWMAAWVLALSPGPWTPFLAGLAVSVAVATRPNLVPLAAVLAFVIAREGSRARRLGAFAAGVAPGCLFIAIVNSRLYGSPMLSGYGPLSTLYAWDRFGENLRRYTSWLVDLHSPAVLVAVAAPFTTRIKAAAAMLVFTALLGLCYVFYFVFDSWPFLRFLLPALPLLFILASGVVLGAVARAPVALRGATVFLIATLLPGWCVLKARDITVFAVHRAEQRYVAIGETVARRLEPNAVVLTVLHSGSIRLYANRATVRWDLVEPDNLDFSLNALREAGYVPYLVLDDWEEPVFRQRFERSHACRRLSGPLSEVGDVATTRLYAFRPSGTPRG